jgi:hypothetical protein
MPELALTGFTPGPITTVTAPQPFSADYHVAPTLDVLELLPPAGADKLRALRQRANDRITHPAVATNCRLRIGVWPKPNAWSLGRLPICSRSAIAPNYARRLGRHHRRRWRTPKTG